MNESVANGPVSKSRKWRLQIASFVQQTVQKPQNTFHLLS